MNKSVALLLGLLLCVPMVMIMGIREYKDITFGIDCGGRLKRAADSNTIELAKVELKAALDYADNHGMDHGSTSVVYETPANDVGFWYKNVKASYDELEHVGPEASQLEKSNILIKLRETLMDHSDKEMKVTLPDNIYLFPSNVGYCWLSIIFLLPGLIGVFLVYASLFEN